MATWAIVLIFVGPVLLFAGWVVWRRRHYLAESLSKVRLTARGLPTGGDDWQDVPAAWRRAIETAPAAVTVPASRNGSAVVAAPALADLPRFGSESGPSGVGSRSRAADASRHLLGARQATPPPSAAPVTTSLSAAVSLRWTYWERRAGLADRMWHRQVLQPRSFGGGLPPPQEIAAKLQQIMLELTRADTGLSGNLEHSPAPAALRMVADTAGRTRGRWPVALAVASGLRAPGAWTEWALEIERTPSPSADAPLVRAARQPGQARAGRPYRAQHTGSGREDLTGGDARNPTIILIDTAVLDALIAAALGPPSSDAIHLHNLITVIEIAVRPRTLVIRAVTMTVGAILKAHGLGVIAPGMGRIITRILIPVLNLILGPDGRHGTLLKILDDLDIGFNAFKGRPTDSTVFRGDLADWLAGARVATPHTSARQPPRPYAPSPPKHGWPSQGPVRDAPSRSPGDERPGAPWQPVWVTEQTAASHRTDSDASPPRPGPTGSSYQPPPPTNHPTLASAAAALPPLPGPSSPGAGAPDPAAQQTSPAANNPEEPSRHAIASAADLLPGTPPTTPPRLSADAPNPPREVTRPAGAQPTGSGKPSLSENTGGSAPGRPSAGHGLLSDGPKHAPRPPWGQSALEPEDSVRPAAAEPSLDGGTAPPAATAGRRRLRSVPTAPPEAMSRISDDEPLVPGGPTSIQDPTEPTEPPPTDRTPRRSLEKRITLCPPASNPRPPRAPAPRPRGAGGPASPC
jgi:hypothetical protein